MADESQFGMDDSELLAIFLQEAREQLDTLDQGLVRLEREPGNVELIQGIFRAAHTLKGSSGAMGLREMAELTHAMEDVLDRVRDGVLAVSSEMTDVLLQGLDLLKIMEQGFEQGQPQAAPQEQVAAVARALHDVAKGDKHGSGKKGVVTKPLAALADTTVALLVNFADDCQMPDIRAFMIFQELKALGEIVEQTPSEMEIEQGLLDRRLLIVFQSEQPEEQLREVILRVPEVAWVRAARGAAATGMSLTMPSREELQGQAQAATGRREAERGVPTNAGVNAQQTVRINVETLDEIMNLVGEMVLDRTRVARLSEELREMDLDETVTEELDAVSHHLGTIVNDLHERVLETRMLPVSQLFNRFPRLVRDLCRNLEKEVDLIVEGETERLDRSVIEKLVDPLTHILRNSIDHGMELPADREAVGKSPRGIIRMAARRSESHVLIQIADDGPGINVERVKEKAVATGMMSSEQVQALSRQDALGLIFASGLSTAQAVSDVSGRGVGMDVVKRNVESLGGIIVVESDLGLGTTITLKIPLTLAIVRALIVKVGQVSLAIPLSFVEETITILRARVQTVRGRGLLKWRDQVVPVIRLADAFSGCGNSAHSDTLQLVTVRYADKVACLSVDNIVGHQEIVVKTLGTFLGDIPGVAGATILGNGRVALIADIANLFELGMLHDAAEEGLRSPAVMSVA